MRKRESGAVDPQVSQNGRRSSGLAGFEDSGKLNSPGSQRRGEDLRREASQVINRKAGKLRLQTKASICSLTPKQGQEEEGGMNCLSPAEKEGSGRKGALFDGWRSGDRDSKLSRKRKEKRGDNKRRVRTADA